MIDNEVRQNVVTPGRGLVRWERLGLICGAVLVALSLAAIVGLRLVENVAGAEIHQESLLAPDPEGHDISGPITILLIGVDARAGSTDVIRADSITIVHVNAAHTAVTMTSMPRDSLVSVPAFPASSFAGTNRAKLTEVYGFGNRTRTGQGGMVGDDSEAGRARGVQLLAKVLSNLTPGGLSINAVAIVNFAGFRKLVEAMGGIDNMCVDETTRSEHFTNQGTYVGETNGNPAIAKIYPVGCYPMQPWEALDFARQRHYLANQDGDYGRQRHQQQLLTTAFRQLSAGSTLADPKKLGAILGAAGDFLTMDLGGNGILDWIFTLRHIRADDITMIKTNAGQFSTVTYNGVAYQRVVPDTVALLGAIHNDTVEAFLASHPSWVSR